MQAEKASKPKIDSAKTTSPQGQPNQKGVGYKRKMMNYLLQPYLQSKIGVFSNGLALLFTASVIAILYFHLRDLVEEVVLLTDAREEVYKLFERELRGVKIWLLFGSILFLLSNVIMSIYQTHRFIGPTVAFRRHIRDLANGDYSRRVTIRNGDAFNEVAYELNRLAHILEQKTKDSDNSGDKIEKK